MPPLSLLSILRAGDAMINCWIETDKIASRPSGVLTANEQKAALSFARLAQDIYPDQTNKNRGSASLVMNWIELLMDPRERSRGINIGALKTAFFRCFGFNAALYKLRRTGGNLWVLSFEGSGSILSLRGLPDWILTNVPTTLSAGNKLERYVPGGTFSKLLNPRGAPSTQYDVADLVTKAAIKLKGNADLVLTGHSLGGGLAQYAAIRNGLKAIVFNSAGIGFSVPNGSNIRSFDTSICHLMTTADAGLIQSLGRIVEGRLFQIMGMTLAVTNPAIQREAMTLYSIGGKLAADKQGGFEILNSLVGQHVNRMVTTYTKVGSKQVGTPYILGYGGHGMNFVIDLLEKGASKAK
ncbi:lipase family protein [Boseaceae bacterium BT-24-1]|nr:lipase family protein [Boseaceae bacterium BT-24-1]